MIKQIELWATMVTPYTSGGEIDWPCVDRMVDWYADNAVSGIFAVCQSSEMFYLNVEEKLELADRVIKRARGRNLQVVVSGHTEESQTEQIRFLQTMAALSPDALVLVSNRLRKADEASSTFINNTTLLLKSLPESLPLGIYECPYPEKVLLRDDEIAFLAQTGRFTFMKDTCCDINRINRRLVLLQEGNMRLFNANTATYLESLQHGADGFCGVMLNIHPKLYRFLSDHFQEKPEIALSLQHFLTTASLIERQQYPSNAKYALNLAGIPILTASRATPQPLCGLYRREVEHLVAVSQTYERLLEQKNDL